jgi:nucleotide-binding universal stress UspA family protein
VFLRTLDHASSVQARKLGLNEGMLLATLSVKRNDMKVLLAIDGSVCSLEAVKEVATRRWPEDTVIKVLAVVTAWLPGIPDPFLIGAAMYVDLMESERKRLHKLVETTAAQLSAACRELRIETMVVDGQPKEVIVEEAEKWGADLILIGSHGYGSVKRLMLGSVSQAVATHAPCSVEIVRPRQGTGGKAPSTV